MEKIICRRTPSGPVVEGVDYRWRYHSTEFNWGYGGSGPADLALNILLEATGDKEAAWLYHQPFKWDMVANLPWEGGEIPWKDVYDWLHKMGYRPEGRRESENHTEKRATV